MSSRMDPIRTQNEASSIVKNHLTEHQEDFAPLTPVTNKKEGRKWKDVKGL